MISSKEKQERLKASLRHSPIGIAVYAWALDDEDGLYFRNGDDNHWCVLFGYEDEKYWKVFDSYDASIKHLKWDYDFGFAKKYYIVKQEEKRPNWFIDLLKRFFFL